MNITYIHHSSFLVEEASVFLLFDYTEGKIPPIPSDAPLYVLVSHSHGDHFSPAIFDLGKKHPRIRFLLSSDISVKSVPQEYRNDPDRLIFLPPHTVWEDSLLKVETFASNDLGVAFWCTLGNRQIYHAGDLNNWFWEGDEEDFRLQEMYHTELKKMAGRTADVAFVPLDPRLGDAFCLGNEYQIEENIRCGK